MDDFACHLLGAGVREPERWQTPEVNCPHGAHPACSGAEQGTVRELKTPQGPTAKAERPEEAKQAEELEEEWNAMQSGK